MGWQQITDKLFARRSDGTQPILLNPRRIYILPSPAGLVYGLLLLAMLTGAINYALALGYALVFLLAGVGLVAMVHTVGNLWGIRLHTQPPQPVFAGDWAHFPLHLQHQRGQARPDLVLAARGQPSTACGLPPQGATRVDLPVLAARRGKLLLPVVEVATRYPLGLFTAWSLLRPEVHCLVYPKPQPWPLPLGRGQDEESGDNGLQGQEDFAGLRERNPADSTKHIAWKAAARAMDHSPLLVKQFAGGAREALILAWDSLPGHDTETRLAILTGWVLQAEAAGHRYGLSIPGTQFPPAQGHNHQQRCLEALALYGI